MGEDVENTSEVLISDRYRVNLDQRIPELDTLGAIAFAANDLRAPEHAVFVLALKPGIPYREPVLKKLLAEPKPGVISPLAQGMITLAEGGMDGERLAVVMSYPTGGRVFPLGIVSGSMPERELRARVIPQILEALESLHEIGISHRGLDLKNIFCRADGNIILGECFTCPPGFNQTSMQEPLESAQTVPEGRGEGTPAHDMFAFGVLIASLYLGRDIGSSFGTLSVLEFDSLMRSRLRQGSYHALASSQDITGPMGELLRGLLGDRTENRWGIEDVKWWLGGLTPHMRTGSERLVLVRPIAFEDKIIQDRRELAFALSQNIPAAARLIRNGKFLSWMENTLIETFEPHWLEKYLDTRPAAVVGEASELADQWAVTRVCAVLDPEGPIRFGGKAYCADGIGSALAIFLALEQTGKLDELRQMITGEPFRVVLEILKERNSRLEVLYRRLFDASKHIENTALGLGFERVLYLLNSQLTCCSPKLSAYYANTAERLLIALEARAGADSSASGWLDPHIAAFIASQSKELEEGIKHLDQVKLAPAGYTNASLNLLGALQNRVRIKSLPHLARSLSEQIKKSISELHSRTYKRQLNTRLELLVGNGDLIRLANELNLASVKAQDDRNFRAAQNQFSQLSRECRKLERPMMPHDRVARNLGYLGSACFSVAILLITAVYLLLNSVQRWT